jgi:Peptidase S24-like
VCCSVGVETLGFKPTPRTFALEVRGDSMIGKGIMDGDVVVLEHGMTPRDGAVVEKGRAFLRAESPRYPNRIESPMCPSPGAECRSHGSRRGLPANAPPVLVALQSRSFVTRF